MFTFGGPFTKSQRQEATELQTRAKEFVAGPESDCIAGGWPACGPVRPDEDIAPSRPLPSDE